jgi:hypothetical protein
VGTILKWVGGAAAVVSLILSAWRLDSVLSQWRGRHAAVANLVAAASLQVNSNDLSGAWETIQRALELEPGSTEARRTQVALAMRQVRGIWRRGGEAHVKETDPFMSVLYSGAVGRDPEFAADVRAHLGWASHLRRSTHNKLDVEAHYLRAIELDPRNVYANAMLGHWILWKASGPQDADRAMEHFRVALNTRLETTFVENLQIDGLIRASERYPEVLLKLVKLANAHRLIDREPHAGLQTYLRPLFHRIMILPNEPQQEQRRRLLLDQLSPKTVREVFNWILSDYGEPTPTDRFIEATLLELEGQAGEALPIYKIVLRKLGENRRLGAQAKSAIVRLSP